MEAEAVSLPGADPAASAFLPNPETPGRALNEPTGEDAAAKWRALPMPKLLLASSFHLASSGDPETAPR